MSVLLIAFAAVNTFLDAWVWYWLLGVLHSHIPGAGKDHAECGRCQMLGSPQLQTSAPSAQCGAGIEGSDWQSEGTGAFQPGGCLGLKMLLLEDPFSHLGDLPGRKVLCPSRGTLSEGTGLLLGCFQKCQK